MHRSPEPRIRDVSPPRPRNYDSNHLVPQPYAHDKSYDPVRLAPYAAPRPHSRGREPERLTYPPPRDYYPREGDKYRDAPPRRNHSPPPSPYSRSSYSKSSRSPSSYSESSRAPLSHSSLSRSRSGHKYSLPRANSELYLSRRPGERDSEVRKKEKKVLGMSRIERAEMQTKLAKMNEKEVKAHEKKVARLESSKKFSKHVVRGW